MSWTLTCIPLVLRKEQGLELGMFVLQCTWKLEGEGARGMLCSFLAAAVWLLDLLAAPREGRKALLSLLPAAQRQHDKEAGTLKTES